MWSLLWEALLALSPSELSAFHVQPVTLHISGRCMTAAHVCPHCWLSVEAVGHPPCSLSHLWQVPFRVCRGPGQETWALPLFVAGLCFHLIVTVVCI